MLTVVGGMAIGVMFGRQPIAGSCGGMKALGMDVQCEICGGDPDRCDSGQNSAARPSDDRTGRAAELATDATRRSRRRAI